MNCFWIIDSIENSAVKNEFKFWFREVHFYDSDIQSFNLLIIIYSVVNLNISKGLSLMDTRLIVMAAPLLVAASWALFNIGRLALQQLQRLNREV